MREINNNNANSVNNLNYIGAKSVAKEDISPSVEVDNNLEVTDLGKMPAEVIGRSQVSKSNLEKDIATYLANPKLVEVSMDFFDKMEAMGYAPEEAASIMGKFAEEFGK